MTRLRQGSNSSLLAYLVAHLATQPTLPEPDSFTYSVAPGTPSARLYNDPTGAVTTPSGEPVPVFHIKPLIEYPPATSQIPLSVSNTASSVPSCLVIPSDLSILRPMLK